MMKYELENFMKPFRGEIDIIIDLGEDGDELPTGVADVEYYMDAHGYGHVKLIPAFFLTRRGDTSGAQQALKKLIDFIEKYNVEDEGASDGHGYYDTWRSGAFEELIEKAKEVIA